jgi:tetratricopeptide (TPR) repeat protein
VNPKVLRRFIILMIALIAAMVIGTDALKSLFSRPPGDKETETGTLRLEDGLYQEAMVQYNKALEVFPNHRGALMGRALVFINTEQYPLARQELDYLIKYLRKNIEKDDTTGYGVLAAAYANRGIVLDRMGHYKLALDDYVRSLQTEPETVAGPGVVNKILYGTERVSTVRDRARYLYEQLQLPEEKRVMRIPELDKRQRMYKP